jgi:hypothetical protein
VVALDGEVLGDHRSSYTRLAVVSRDRKTLRVSTPATIAQIYTNQDYVHVNYTLIVIYSTLLVTGSQSKNVSCFCLDMAQ